MISISSSISQINPAELFTDGFELQNQTVIPMEQYSGSFTPELNSVEFYVYDANKQVQYSNYDFDGFAIYSNTTPGASPAGKPSLPRTTNPNLYGRENNYTSERNSTRKFQLTTDTIALNPEEDVYNAGFTNGTLYGIYNFVNLELSSSIDNPYYLSEISSDRTEIRLKSNFISNNIIQSSFLSLDRVLKAADYFDEFYISFGQNEYHIGVNTQLSIPPADQENQQYSVLIKLYDPLPIQYGLLDELYVVTKTAETQAFQINYIEDLGNLDNVTFLQGPNTNLKIKDFINNSTTYKSKNELLGTQSTGSKDQLLNRLKQTGITLTPNYSTSSFDEFVNFSSAKSRVQNFYDKVGNIQSYEADISTLNKITGSNEGVNQISSSIASLYTKIEDEISNFDGFEYYQYYNTSSDAYPKTGSSFPLELLSTSSAETLRWLGSDTENSQYYGGTLLSASLYDDNNANWLYYTVPDFIKENSDNDNYLEFVNMTGQSFDEMWLYTKAITEKLNTTNQLDKGVPMSLADDVITSLGYTGFGNNYNNQDNFIGLIGSDNGSFVPSTGSELITQYIAINNGQIANYWEYDYSVTDYVQSLVTAGFPYPIDKVSNEIFKRLYHNMAYLVKKKGTVAGLRQLINIWGIPSTILRINEFGGKNKDQTDDYDLWYNRYSYAYKPVADSYNASSSVVVPWLPLKRNYIAESGSFIVPDGVGFRFKTTGHPSSSFGGNYYSQSLIAKKSNGLANDDFDFSVNLFWTGSTSGSYSGSGNSDYYDYGVMNLMISGSGTDGGTAISDDIYLPFFDKGWWSVLVQRNKHVNSIGLSSGLNGLLTTLNSGGSNVNPTNCTAGIYPSVQLGDGTGTGAFATVTCARSGSGTPDPIPITSITLTKTGTGYIVGDTLTIAAGALGLEKLDAGDLKSSITSPAGTYTTAGFPGPNGGGIYNSIPLTTATGVGFGGDVNAITNEQGGITSLTVDTAGEDYSTGDQLTIASGAVGGGTIIEDSGEGSNVVLSYAGGGTNTIPAGTYVFEDTGGTGTGLMNQTAGTNGDNLSIRFSVAEPGNVLPSSVEVLKPGFGYGGNCTWNIPGNIGVGNTPITVTVAAAFISQFSEAITITLQSGDVDATNDQARIVLTGEDLANGDNGQPTTYTLYAKNKLYDGNDGNSLGFEGSASISTGGSAGSGATYGDGLYGSGVYGTFISSSINKAWSKFGNHALPDGMYVGGALQGVEIAGFGGNTIVQEPGKIFSGSLQEFRYYSHDISESVFNDFVMNPESIEGNRITGSESSFDIVNFRAPLGNELESFFTASQSVTSSIVYTFLTSSHPAVTASAPEFITGSFIDTATDTYNDYQFIQYQNTTARTFSEPNTETYFLDQPAVGIRNRISNKIQATSNLNFGNVLSNQVSIQKDPFISQSYTENINTLEVAFSPQAEIDDDIIASLGYGAIQEVLADPRFRSSSDDYYPQLRKIAGDYFKKYEGSDVYDYLRLIKYFDDSLFRAIKNYVPARTSVSTGIVIKQNLLERNRYREPQMDIVTTQSYATTNVPLTYKNLMLSGSVYSQSVIVGIEGGAGGPYNAYNTLETGSVLFQLDGPITNATFAAATEYNLLYRESQIFQLDAASTNVNVDLFGNDSTSDVTQGPFFTVNKSIRTPLYWNPKYTGASGPGDFTVKIYSNKRGLIYTAADRQSTTNPAGQLLFTSRFQTELAFAEMHPGERLRLFVNFDSGAVIENDSNQSVVSFGNSADIFNLLDGTPLVNSASVNLPMSQQGYFANQITNLGAITSSFVGNQEQFYNGELSGSDLNAGQYYLNQYNPYNRVPGNSTSSAAFQEELPVQNFTTYGSSSKTSGTPANNGFTLITANGFSVDTNSPAVVGARFAFAASASLIPLQNYLVTFDANVTVNLGSNPIGLSSFGVQNGVNVINGAGFGDASGQVDSISITTAGSGYTNATYPTIPKPGFSTGTGLTVAITTAVGGVALATIVDGGRGYRSGDKVFILGNAGSDGLAELSIISAGSVSLSGTGQLVVSHSFMAYPTPGAPLDYQSLSLQVGTQIEATISNFKVEGQGGEFVSQVAPIYLNPLQQDQWQILNTQSFTFDNSDYNPLNNNINPQRPSDFRYALSYNNSQNQPTEFNNIVTWSYDNQSPSASRPLAATLEDSNYTQQAYTLPRYKGSKLISLDYNFFTPSGTVGPIQSQPTAPYNKGYGYSSSVANEFLDGATGSYTGDLSFGQTSAINKNPQYIAHFQSSYSPTSFYQSMQFNVDTLIQIPMESIGGSEITPNSIQINGNNENKKFVSSVFEPNRKLQFTFDDLTFNGIQYGTLPVGPYKILNSATVFQTINANAKNFQSESLAYQYQIASVPVSTSINEPLGTIQMVTASNIEVVGGVPIQSNGFLLSGSNTLFDVEGSVEDTELVAGGSSGGTGNTGTTALTGTGTGATINVLTVSGGGGILTYSDLNAGTGYKIGDTLSVGGFNSAVIRVTDIIGESDNNMFLPFATSQSINEPTIPNAYRLEMAGPQLALYHTYNKLVESGSTREEPFCLANSNFVPFSASQLWIKDGLDPRDTDNYYSWYPSGSNCTNYADYQQPFLINRGDVIRVEGLREIFVANSIPSQSLAFNEDFTVLGVQNFRNSGSSSGGGTSGNFIVSPATIGTTVGVATVTTIVFTQGNGTDAGTFSTNGSGTGGSLSLTSTVASKGNYQITSGFLVVGSSTGYAVGDTLTVTSTVLNAAGFGTTFGTVIVTLTAANLTTGGTVGATGFTLKVDSACWNGDTSTYSEQAIGSIETVTPTFLEVTPDPLVALNGLQGGAITKYTIRRELEQDDRVMIRGIQAPSGSRGTDTQSGGGYIIPNDLSLQQKLNAVNIINQLRAKNAFPSPNQTS